MKRAGVSVLAVGLAGVGLVYVWSAVHGANITASLRDILAGRAPAAPGTDPDVTDLGRVVPSAGAVGSVAGNVGTNIGGAVVGGAAGGVVGSAANKANGQLQAAGYGWTGDQWTALDKLWTRESDWNNTAQNPHSTAYGIAQFLDATWAGVGGSKTSDPTLQIRYGLAYIKNRYGTPAAAWAHELSAGWY